MTAKWKGYVACIFFLNSLHGFKPGGAKGNATAVRGVELDKLFAPVHVLALQSAFASFNKHRSSLWKHTVDVLFLFHFPVNRKRAMAGFSLRWEDPNLMILRNTDLICGSGIIFC